MNFDGFLSFRFIVLLVIAEVILVFISQFWFHNLPTKEYIVRFDAIKKRINELEQEND